MGQWQNGLVTNVLFPCPPPTYTINSFPGELIWVPGWSEEHNVGGGEGLDGIPTLCENVPCLLLPYESARFLAIFFHSNADDLGRCRWFCHFLRDQFQIHILAVEYPGYGVCTGTVSRESVLGNARAALRFVTRTLKLPLDQVMIFGRSIGTGPALELARTFKVAAVILVTPFTSVKDLFRDKVGPFALLVDEWFRNDEAIKQVHSPTMIIHGQKDRIIPWQHGEALFKACQDRKIFINPPLMEHNTNLAIDSSYLIIPMFRFFTLPDYSFVEMQVPPWVFDKRRSPLYTRPDVQVSSHSCVSSCTGDCSGGLSTPIPAGDDPEAPLLLDADPWLQSPQDLKGRVKSAVGDSPVVDYEKFAVLTHPTVLHTYRATKMRYEFLRQAGEKEGMEETEGTDDDNGDEADDEDEEALLGSYRKLTGVYY